MDAGEIVKDQKVEIQQKKIQVEQEIPVSKEISIYDDIIKEGDPVIIYESIESLKMLNMKQGEKLQNKFGLFPHDAIIGQQFGSKKKKFQKIYSHNSTSGYVYVLKPDPTLITETLSHKTQILYQTDISLILMKLNILPGSIVVESGTGSGSLSSSISQCIKQQGHLFTFEYNQERAENARFVFQNLLFNNVTVVNRDVLGQGFEEKDDQKFGLKKCDAVFLDLPKPWVGITHSLKILRRGGQICCFSPCIEQVQMNCRQLEKEGFIQIQTIQALSRFFERNVKHLTNLKLEKQEEVAPSTDQPVEGEAVKEVVGAESITKSKVGQINASSAQNQSGKQRNFTDFKGQNKNKSNQSASSFTSYTYFSSGQQQQQGHTGYLTFALLP